jgi:pyridoxal phosphate enzyme (YggS family)
VSLAENIALVRERIASAAQRAGRNPAEITLMAVSKTVQPGLIHEAYNSGIRQFGESRVQEFAAKNDTLRDLRDADWHMIGHLQNNKAAKAAEMFSAIDSLDSLRLAEKLNAFAQVSGKKISVLIEINVGGDTAKSGVPPDSPEFEALLQAAPKFDHLDFRGLMTVPPFTDDAQQARPYFRKLLDLRDQIASQRMPSLNVDVLSMGMSHDFEVAIEEGSTCVRVGTAIFGVRGKM